MKKSLIFALLFMSCSGFAKEINSVLIHPPFSNPYQCSEHWDGQFKYPGDALGADCVIQGFYDKAGRVFMRPYSNNGYKNEDWFGWNKPVLAPCQCIVDKIQINNTINQPGITGKGLATSITFKKNDGTFILLAHLAYIKVKEGELVKYGQEVAKVGNNGYSRNPHVHIGAWKETEPLQIRFDQKYMGKKYNSAEQN